MRQAIVTVKGISPYAQSGYVSPEKFPKTSPGEKPADYEKRLWRERMHYDADGIVYIPPMAFKNSITSAASFLGEKYKGQKTYTKLFESGVMVIDPLPLGVNKDTVPGEWLFLPSDGRRGGGKRVMKCFGRIDKWGGDVTLHVLHDAITQDVLGRHVECAGTFIGVGFFRPQNNGYWGRFAVEKIKYEGDWPK